MPGFLLSKLKQAQPSMRRRLFLYMGALAALLLAVLLVALLLLGRLKSPRAETEKALIYLSVAAHQNPDCLKYIRALNEAQGIRGGAMRRFARFARRG